MKFNFAAQKGGPFAHAEQPEGFSVPNFLVGNAPTIVSHFQDKMVPRFRQSHLDPGSPGMTDDIGQRFLKYSEKRGVQTLI